MTVLLRFGTRPEWLKIKPLIKVLPQYKLLFTEQHTDTSNLIHPFPTERINNEFVGSFTRINYS